MNLPNQNKKIATRDYQPASQTAKTTCSAPDGSLFMPASIGNERDTRTSDDKSSLKDDMRRCMYCGQVASLVWVHGHGQCSACGINVDECCRGENCEQ